MSWRLVVVNRHSKLSYQNGSLVYKHEEGAEKLHLSEIHTLLVETTDVSITTALISKLSEYNISLIFCDANHNPCSQCIPYYGNHDTSKKIRMQVAWGEKKKQTVWTEVVRQKISNQASHLRKRNLTEEATLLESYLGTLKVDDETNREGHAAKVYFNALFGKGFTRDNNDDINAGLNYGYTLLLAIFNRQIVANGCITQLGLKHSNYFNPFNLSSDFMEPFRVLADEIIFEYRDHAFSGMKFELFEMLNTTYQFQGQEMFLENIIGEYVKKSIKVLGSESDEMPRFERL
jgi:CRISPR-associated endonuclease Cas1 subtype II